ncbi:MAG: MarR family transcriptional regulator [Eudoraea sp.]|nr:MarR family transcriptional regulator [Eudoraea sp.]
MKKGQVDIEFDNSIGPWLGKTAKIVAFHIHEELEKAGLDITKEQMVILKKIYERDGLSQNELAILTYRDKSSLTRLLSTMERKDYIYRKRCEEDKRVNFVHLTTEGNLMWERAKPVVQKVIQRMRSDLTENEAEQLIQILKKIQGSLANTEVSLVV